MPRTIPVALQQELAKPVQTTTRCIRMQLRDGRVFGVTMLDRDVVYDHLDGFGAVTYSAANGFDPSTISSDIGYSVSNAEGRMLVAADIPGLTVEMVETGQLDDGEWTCFLLNFSDPQPGSAAILDAGDLGEVKTERGLVLIPELLSYAMRFRQSVGGVFQRPCRAIFGTPAASQTGCGVDASGLWKTGTVQSIGAESDRAFTGDIAGHFPGRLEFLTGANVGKRYAIESVNGNTIVLAEPTPYAIEPDDTYRHRADCTKLKDGPLGCVSHGNYLNYKGEDLIPVGDGVAVTTPGGQLPGGGGWVGEQPVQQQ